MAVILVDLDGFKPVNDQLGHEAGDEILKMVAARLRESVCDTDLVGRVGGDEFMVFCPAYRTPVRWNYFVGGSTAHSPCHSATRGSI